jgi:hypothetical protein
VADAPSLRYLVTGPVLQLEQYQKKKKVITSKAAVNEVGRRFSCSDLHVWSATPSYTQALQSAGQDTEPTHQPKNATSTFYGTASVPAAASPNPESPAAGDKRNGAMRSSPTNRCVMCAFLLPLAVADRFLHLCSGGGAASATSFLDTELASMRLRVQAAEARCADLQVRTCTSSCMHAVQADYLWHPLPS